MGIESEVGVPTSATFTQELDALKREGSNILLVGDTGTEAHRSACQRQLGDESQADRYRLFVATEETQCRRSHPPAEVESMPRTRYVLQQSSEVRPAPSGVDSQSVTRTTMLGVLGTTVVEAINEFDADAGGLDPSELRVCVDSLDSLLEEYPSETVFRLLHVVTTRVRQSNGMGHFHLPVDRNDDTVHLLEPLFDAIVEVRSGDDGPEHRWHLRDGEASSDWLAL